jgi:hypothetical protein
LHFGPDFGGIRDWIKFLFFVARVAMRPHHVKRMIRIRDTLAI